MHGIITWSLFNMFLCFHDFPFFKKLILLLFHPVFKVYGKFANRKKFLLFFLLIFTLKADPQETEKVILDMSSSVRNHDSGF